MDQAKLVDMVTEELMRRLGMRGGAPAGKPLLVAGEPGCCEAPPGVDVEYASRGAEPEWRDYSGVVVPCLSENQLVLASLGLKYGLESSVMVGALLAGVPVYVLKEGVSWRLAACCDTPLARHYAACEERLRSFGAKYVEAGELSGTLRGAAAANPSPLPASGGTADARGRKVLTERDLKDICQDAGSVLVDPRAVITPLGQDWLRLKKIAVRREGAQ